MFLKGHHSLFYPNSYKKCAYSWSKLAFNRTPLAPTICNYSRRSPLEWSSESLALPWLQTRDSDLLVQNPCHRGFSLSSWCAESTDLSIFELSPEVCLKFSNDCFVPSPKWSACPLLKGYELLTSVRQWCGDLWVLGSTHHSSLRGAWRQSIGGVKGGAQEGKLLCAHRWP